jgi:hypothetical protein
VHLPTRESLLSHLDPLWSLKYNNGLVSQRAFIDILVGYRRCYGATLRLRAALRCGMPPGVLATPPRSNLPSDSRPTLGPVLLVVALPSTSDTLRVAAALVAAVTP